MLINLLRILFQYDQEIMILPVGAQRFEEAMQMGSETYHHLKVSCSSYQFIVSFSFYLFFKKLLSVEMQAVIAEKYGAHGCNVGEDGGLAPDITRHVYCLLINMV